MYFLSVSVKRKPHHDLAAIQNQFSSKDTLIIKSRPLANARDLGFDLNDIIAVVQALERRDFVKSETAHSPPNSRVWHDSYVIPFDGLDLYLKFAGEALIDLALVSFKEK